MCIRNFDSVLFHITNILFFIVAGEPGRASARAGASVAGGTYRCSTRPSDDHKVAAADQQGIFYAKYSQDDKFVSAKAENQRLACFTNLF